MKQVTNITTWPVPDGFRERPVRTSIAIIPTGIDLILDLV